MSRSLLGLDAASYRRHPLHAQDRCWMETNCYVDVWIEVLHALGLDPVAAGAFTFSTDFEGDQWTFFKIPPEDLRALYGLEVAEMNAWQPIVEHVDEQLELGRLLTVEADSWFLPDTQGVAYRTEHVKSTIVPERLDLDARRVGYFHNAGYFELEGDDFDGLFGLDPYPQPLLPPYVELVKLERIWHDEHRLLEVARSLARQHLARRPTDNPVVRMGKRLEDDRSWLEDEGIDHFHRYAFGTCRQCGATAEIAAAFCEWLSGHDDQSPYDQSLSLAASAFRELANGAKALQFGLARMVAGRRSDTEPVLAGMADAWDRAYGALLDRYGP